MIDSFKSRLRILSSLLVLMLLVATACSAAPGAASMRVTLLGTGAIRPEMDRFGPSLLVEAGGQKLLFDCGRGVSLRLNQLDLETEVHQLFLSHLHSDHTLGFPDLWLTSWCVGRTEPFEVWGPRGTQDMMKHLTEAFAFDIHERQGKILQLPASGAAIQAHDINEGVAYNKDGVKVTAFLVDHGDVKPAYGYRIDYGGRSVVFSGDTRPTPNLIKYARGVNLLIHEVIVSPEGPLPPGTAQKVQSYHTTPEQAAAIFTQTQPKLALYTHIILMRTSMEDLRTRTKAHYKGRFEIGHDLMQIEVGKSVTVLKSAR